MDTTLPVSLIRLLSVMCVIIVAAYLLRGSRILPEIPHCHTALTDRIPTIVTVM